MNLNELIEHNVQVTISARDLKIFALDIVREVQQQNAKQEDELLTKKEACSVLNITIPTLNRWAKCGYISPVRKGGRVYYSKKDITKTS